MGKDLLIHPVFRDTFERVDKLLHKYTGWSVLEKLSNGMHVYFLILLLTGVNN